MIYNITFDEQMLIRRRVRVEAEDEDMAVDKVLSGAPYPSIEILKVVAGDYDNFKIEKSH